jgi:hypothetical protein
MSGGARRVAQVVSGARGGGRAAQGAAGRKNQIGTSNVGMGLR